MEQHNTISPKDLESGFRSKQDLYSRLTNDCQFYLPSFRRCPISFLKDLLSDEKLAYRTHEIRQFKVSFYTELAVGKVFPKIKNQEMLMKYLPDLSEGELPERTFFYSILGTLFPKELSDIISAARKHRALSENPDKSELIKMTPEMYNEITSLLSHPTTPGKANYLLKSSSILKKKRIPPKNYEIDLNPIIFKKFRVQRLKRKPEQLKITAFLNRDEQMQIENENTDREESKSMNEDKR